MEGRLQEAIKNKNTLEVQRRLERLLGKLTVPGSISLNQERIRTPPLMMILHQIGHDRPIPLPQPRRRPRRPFAAESRLRPGD